jgi:hypothetical protein
MPLPLIPIAIFGLAGGAWYAERRRAPKAPDAATFATRQAIFGQALNSKLPPDKLRAMAKAYRDSGMMAEAHMLDLRVALAEAPPEVKEARRQALKAGLASDNVPAIRDLARAFESLGATGAADKLREYAGAVEQTQHEQQESAAP